MNEIRQFVRDHTSRTACRCGKCQTDGPASLPGHTLNMVFFDVSVVGEPDPAVLKRLIRANKDGEFCTADLFDRQEHGYQEVGAWIGDQGSALLLMALGHMMGLWKCLTPYTIFPGLDDGTAKLMAGAGYITIKEEFPGVDKATAEMLHQSGLITAKPE